jgi:hypothetical protein
MYVNRSNWSRFLLVGGLLAGRLGTAQAQQKPQLQRIFLGASAGPDSLLRLGGTLTLEASHLPPGIAPHSLTLYLNGIPLRGLRPLAAYNVADSATATSGVPAAATGGAPESQPDSSASAAPAALARPDFGVPAGGALTRVRVVFALRPAAAPTAWALADGPPWQPAHSVRVGLGTSQQQLAELRSSRAVQLAPAEGWLAGLGLAALAGLLLLVAAARSWLLRTPVAAFDEAGQLLAVGDAAPPYSLGRVQLAWWSWLILGGGLASAGATGALPAVPAATLALLGVSVATAVLAALAPTRATSASSEAAPQSRGWLADLLCDERGLSIYRLQFVLTSLAVGGSFAYALYATGGLPAWPLASAGLLAFSALAYVGPQWRRVPQVGTALTSVATLPFGAAPTPPAWPLAPAGPPLAAAPAPDYAAATHPDAQPRPVVAAGLAAAASAPPAKAADLSGQPAIWPAGPPPPLPAAPRPADPPPPVAAVPVAAVVLPVVAAVAEPEAAAATQSRANPETGEVLYHEEDDMGPLEEEDYPSWPAA